MEGRILSPFLRRSRCWPKRPGGPDSYKKSYALVCYSTYTKTIIYISNQCIDKYFTAHRNFAYLRRERTRLLQIQKQSRNSHDTKDNKGFVRRGPKDAVAFYKWDERFARHLKYLRAWYQAYNLFLNVKMQQVFLE